MSVIAACGAPPVAVPDAGDEDAGRDAGTIDAGTNDAGHPDAGVDAGTDAGVDAGVDAGTDAGVDAGLPSDAGVDAGASPDAGLDAGLDAGAVDAGCAPSSGIGAPFTLRAMAANLSSGNLQSYDPGPGIRIIQGLSPDVVMIQEMNYGTNDAAGMAAFMLALDAGYTYTRGAGQLPNGVLSRYPIADAGEWTDPRVSNRTFVWALLDLPGPRDLWVVSVHLLTSTPSERDLEAHALLALLGASVPPSDFLLVGGDFNTDNFGEPALTTFAARVWDALPAPADQAGIQGTNATRARPYDHVLTSACLVPLQLDAGLVFDSRVYMPLTDVPPVLQTDSAAPNMQHMAVVKDFLIAP